MVTCMPNELKLNAHELKQKTQVILAIVSIASFKFGVVDSSPQLLNRVVDSSPPTPQLQKLPPTIIILSNPVDIQGPVVPKAFSLKGG